MSCDVLEARKHQSFKGPRDQRHQSVRPVVIQSCEGGFLGDWDDGGALEVRGDFIQLQGSGEDLCEDWSQLDSTGLRYEGVTPSGHRQELERLVQPVNLLQLFSVYPKFICQI